MTNEQLAECYRAGLTIQEIADCYGIQRDTVWTRLKRMGVERRKRGPRPAKRERTAVSTLLDQGMTECEIAKQAGCSQSLVAKVARLKGW